VGGEQAGMPRNVHVRNSVSDEEMSRLYAQADCLLALSKEDFGLTPVEAHAHGTPVLALRQGGYLETIDEGVNGLFAQSTSPTSVAAGLTEALDTSWDADAIRHTTERFSEERFLASMEACVETVLAEGSR
jgi:glycosyltransferase involved in cell wall biosynthesis